MQCRLVLICSLAHCPLFLVSTTVHVEPLHHRLLAVTNGRSISTYSLSQPAAPSQPTRCHNLPLHHHLLAVTTCFFIMPPATPKPRSRIHRQRARNRRRHKIRSGNRPPRRTLPTPRKRHRGMSNGKLLDVHTAGGVLTHSLRQTTSSTKSFSKSFVSPNFILLAICIRRPSSGGISAKQPCGCLLISDLQGTSLTSWL